MEKKQIAFMPNSKYVVQYNVYLLEKQKNGVTQIVKLAKLVVASCILIHFQMRGVRNIFVMSFE